MSNNAIDKVIAQAKLLPEGEFHAFCNDLTSALYTTSPNACLASLRQLFLFLHSSNHQRCLPQQLIDGLVKLLLIPDATRWPTKLLSNLVLAELAPAPEISLPLANLPWDDSQVPYVLTVARAQLAIRDSFLLAIIPQLTRWLSTVGSSAVVQGCTLAALEAIHRLHTQLVTWEQVSIVRSQLCCWLKEATLQQAPNPYTRAIFRKDEATLPTVTELDGAATKNFFTVLCVGQYYTADQLMNIHTFSTLRSWIQVSNSLSISQTSSSHSSRSSTPSTDREERVGGLPSGGTVTLPEACMQYALRLLEQCDRRPKMPQDAELQQSALVEAIGLLDQLCSRDPSLIPRVFEAIKRVFNQYIATKPRILIPIIQFFINHSEAVVYDPSQAYQNFFHTLGNASHSTALAYDGITFVQDNLAALCEAKLLQKFFPSLFKVLAWNPLCYTKDFMDILPACMSPTSTLEMIHRILDLPCLTATLELNMRANAKSDSNSNAQLRQNLVPQQCLKAFKDPEAMFIFKYVLNAEGGFGDTIDKLSQLHQMLGRMTRHPRVVCASEAAPTLLEEALCVSLLEGDLQLSSNMIPVLLERARLLLNISQFKTKIRSVLASYWLAVMEKYPQLVTDYLVEILEFISTTHSQSDMEELNIHLLWTLGEYLSPRHSNKCSPEVLVQAYESLETVAYELVQMNGLGYSARLITTLSSTLAKLASRSQDLIARTVLCVSKLGQLASSGHLEGIAATAVADRASELVNILKLPNIAGLLLSPPDMDKQRWHRDVMKLPLLLQTTHSILHVTSGAGEDSAIGVS